MTENCNISYRDLVDDYPKKYPELADIMTSGYYRSSSAFIKSAQYYNTVYRLKSGLESDLNLYKK